ncbi:MAG: acyl--CoA ligase [Firmicutes bacterium]|nr:acyl--CoA ligase [Bacillota bacterium]
MHKIQSLYDRLNQSAKQYAQKTAVIFFNRRISYAKYIDLIDRAAAGLRKIGIGKGSVVTVCMPNTPSAAIAFYAINRLGAIVNLVHPFSPPNQIISSIKKTQSSLLIAYDLYLGKHFDLEPNIPVLQSKIDYFMPALIKKVYRFKNKKLLLSSATHFESLFNEDKIDEEPIVFNEHDRAVFLPSGGTTSDPKIVMHTGKVFNDLCAHAQFFLSDQISNYTAMYSVLPIFHGFGLCMNMHMSALYGVTNIMTPKFNAKQMAKAIKKHRVNILTGVPMMYQKLLNCKKFLKTDLSSIKDCFVGGDSASNKLIEEFNAVLKKGGSKAQLFQGYGLTEAISVCTVERNGEHALGSAGVGVPGSKIKIFDTIQSEQLKNSEIGEIAISSPYLMLGYLGDISSPIKEINGEKWLFTGDLGYIKDGLLFFKQRIKSMIKVAGVPVFPSEVEEAAMRVDGVTAAAAIGIEDNTIGEMVKLFVEYKGTDDKIEENIRTECEASLIKYAVPKEIVIKDNLPKTAIGKVDKRGLE